MRADVVLLTALLAAAPLLRAEPSITNTAAHQSDRSAYVFYRGEISLPVDGYWDASVATTGIGVVEFHVVPPAKAAEIQMGRRMLAAENDQQLRRGQYVVSQLYWPCR